jgi:ribosome maturation factor RimP
LFVAQDDSVQRLIARTVHGLGYELVELSRSPRGRLIRVFLDRADGITVDDCAMVSNQLSRVLAVEGVDYERLEVSSPGLDRPLKSPADFQRFTGEAARLRLLRPVDGRANFEGILRGCDGETVLLEVGGVQHKFAVGDVERARLVPRY